MLHRSRRAANYQQRRMHGRPLRRTIHCTYLPTSRRLSRPPAINGVLPQSAFRIQHFLERQFQKVLGQYAVPLRNLRHGVCQQRTMFTALDALGGFPQRKDKQIQRIYNTSEVTAHKSDFLRYFAGHRLSRHQNNEHSTPHKVNISTCIRVSLQNLRPIRPRSIVDLFYPNKPTLERSFDRQLCYTPNIRYSDVGTYLLAQ